MTILKIPTTTKYLNELTPHPENYNSHPASQIKELAESLSTFGQFKNIVTWTCPENMTTPEGHELHEGLTYILAGHGLWLAAMEAGVDDLEVKDYSGLSYDMAIGLLLVDNAAPLGSEPIPDKLAALLARTREMTADRPGLGAMLERLRERAGINGNGHEAKDIEPQIDKAAELQKVWGTELGQIWQLGNHRLAVGDCTDRATVEAVMRGERADLVFTSPPYNRGTTTGGGFPSRGGMWQGAELANGYATHSDNMPVEKYRDWQRELLLSWWDLLVPDGAIFYNHRPRVQDGILETPLDWNPNLPVRQIVIWHSGAGVNFAPTHYRPACEWIVIFAKPQFRLKDKSVSGVGDVWQFGAEQNPSHPAPFPVELSLTAIETTGAGIIFEPFSGSGTVIISAENLGRRCRAIELDPGYAAVSLQRWADLTGQQPKQVAYFEA